MLRFLSDSMPIFPKGQNAISRLSEWGTLIKVYEYDSTGFPSHILRKDGLLYRFDILMPDIALPVRLYECRSYRGHKGSHETTLTGIRVRLEDNVGDNLEISPIPCEINVDDEKMLATIYIFKKGKARTYLKNEGVIFTINGQTNAHLTAGFFGNAGLGHLHDSLLVIIDCSHFSKNAKKDFFMASRDRLKKGKLTDKIKDELIDVLKHNQILRDLNERRIREETEARLKESKPLTDILASLVRYDPILSSLLLEGKKGSIPFKHRKVGDSAKPVELKKYPSFFKFKGYNYGHILRRDCEIKNRCRVTFDTDVVFDFFMRANDPGNYRLYHIINNDQIEFKPNSFNPHDNGIFTLNFYLPEYVKIGDKLKYKFYVYSSDRFDPFINEFELTVIRDSIHTSGTKTKSRPPSNKEGKDRDMPSGFEIPPINKVAEYPKDNEIAWSKLPKGGPFDQYSALRIIHDLRNTNDNLEEVYSFYINIDNIYLKMEQKLNRQKQEIAEARFILGMVLIGLSMLRYNKEDRRRGESIVNHYDEEGTNFLDNIEEFSKAIAFVLLPMLIQLSEVDIEKRLSSIISDVE